MRPFTSASLAAASALVWITGTDAARPRYGGILRVETSAVMRSLNPAAAPIDSRDAVARTWLHPLIFETLVAAEASGGLRPVLATEWSSDAGATRWRFRLRSRVMLHDGTPLDAGRVAAALRAHDPAWSITPGDGVVTIEGSEGLPDLPWRLADPGHAVAFARPAGGEPIGTGPFAIDRWELRRLRLRSHEDYWDGRPFVDAVHIEMGRAAGDQLASLALGKADFVSLQPQDVRRVARGMRVTGTRPIELIVLVFEGRGRADAWRPARTALSQAIDRASISTVLLQGYAAPASTIVPEWLGGYASLLAQGHTRARAKSAVAALPSGQRSLTLTAAAGDGLLRTVADRVAVDAREAGLSIVVDATAAAARTPPPDVRLLRVRLQATTRERALASALDELAARTQFSPPAAPPRPGASFDAVFRFEQRLAEGHVVIPVVHLPDLYVSAADVDSWLAPIVLPSGAWNLAAAWLRAERR